MKRYRLGTLMMLIVIVAQGIALVTEQVRHRRREAELRAQLAGRREELILKYYMLDKRYKELRSSLERQADSQAAAGGVASDGK